MQYFAYPEWKYDRLRTEHPDGAYEAAAAIRPGQWISLRLDVAADSVEVQIDGIRTLAVTPKVPVHRGGVGLFVDIGTDAVFADLTVERSD